MKFQQYRPTADQIKRRHPKATWVSRWNDMPSPRNSGGKWTQKTRQGKRGKCRPNAIGLGHKYSRAAHCKSVCSHEKNRNRKAKG